MIAGWEEMIFRATKHAETSWSRNLLALAGGFRSGPAAMTRKGCFRSDTKYLIDIQTEASVDKRKANLLK